MTIAAGTRLGPFEVIDLLGAGGMGAVYRAYDPRLRREVAIKVLPAAFASDAERLQRFEREALAVARLTHPNILAIHDVGTFAEAPYLVTELLDGQSLRDKLNGPPLPVAVAVDYASQVARGLAATHAHDIVHRDIKPDNLFVTTDGRVKILDFGLAKLTDVGTETGATAVTLTMHGAGVLGTAAYMAPEQARGLRTDHRADLFSLGIVLYEMLSGVSPFLRETTAETMTAILREEPPPFAAPIACPPALERIMRHCLMKAPAERFQSARDLAFSLEAMSAAAPVVMPARRRWPIQAWLALVAISALVVALIASLVTGRETSESVSRPDVIAVHRLTDFSGLEEFPAIAPDLKSVAFTARVNGTRQIFVRLLAGGTPLQVTKDAVDLQLPRWSPDSSAMVYFSPAAPGQIQGTIWEIPALGGAPRRMIDSLGGGDLGPHGRLTCFRAADGRVELITAAADGSDVRVLASFDEPVYYKFPRWSPDAQRIAFQRGDGVRWDIFVVPAAGGSPHQLTHENGQIHGLAWLPDSARIVYSSGRGATMPYLPTLGLWESSLDGGAPRRIAAADLSYLHPDVHASGAMAASRLRIDFDLWKYPVAGLPEDNVRRGDQLTRQTGQVQTPTVGANDREIAFLSDSGGHANLWVMAPESGEVRQITYERDPDVALGVPIWSPSGEWIAFVSSRGNLGLGFGVWVIKPDGGNLRNLATRGLGVTWSADAQWVYYADAGGLYKVSIAGGSPIQVRSGAARNVVGFDGKSLYFMVDRTLTDGSPGFEIHAASPEDAPSRVLGRVSASRAPQWQIINPALSPDGRSLAMPLTDGVTTNIWTLSTSTGEWRQVTDFGDRPLFIARRVSWSADGQSIVAAIGDGDADIVLFER
jgi:serine/threonine protein kinase